MPIMMMTMMVAVMPTPRQALQRLSAYTPPNKLTFHASNAPFAVHNRHVWVLQQLPPLRVPSRHHELNRCLC